jgi:flotillin
MNTIIMMAVSALASLLVLVVIFGALKSILKLRTVVPPTEVHIVQSQKAGRVTYGQLRVAHTAESTEGASKPSSEQMRNTYYRWPTWLPLYGVQVSVLPLSVFSLDLNGYEAYDKERVPFNVDVKAFYRIDNAALAAERISNIGELKEQLKASLQGAVRKILAEYTIEEIMQGRSEFGRKFTTEVDPDLMAWGVATVKSIELMDIKDAPGQTVIEAISAKRISGINKESRVAVAENERAAREAEIAAQRQVDVQAADAQEQVGLRKAEVTKKVGIAEQSSKQEVAKKEAETATAEMEVVSIRKTREAEIDKNVQVVNAERDKEVQIIAAERDKSVQVTNAERDKQVTVTKAEAEASAAQKASEGEKAKMINLAEGNLAAATKEAEGIRAKGEAEGAALTAKAMAPVSAEIKLQEAIGNNTKYQDFVVRQKQVDAGKEIGIQQARSMGEALGKAKIKVLSNLGAGASGLGQQLGSLLEGFSMTGMGSSFLSKIGIKAPDDDDNDDETGSTSSVASIPTQTTTKGTKKPNGASPN